MSKRKYQPRQISKEEHLLLILKDKKIDSILAAELLRGIRVVDNGYRTECWVRGYDSLIYTSIRVGNKRVQAHRVSYELFTGKILHHHGCHKCDVPACINPDHIFDGNDSANHKDSESKSRQYPHSALDKIRKEVKFNHDKYLFHEVDGIDREWEEADNFIHNDTEEEL